MCDLDIEKIAPIVTEEIRKGEGKQARATKEAEYEKKREIIASEYSKLESTSTLRAPIPSLRIYRELPTINTLLKDDEVKPVDLRDELKKMSVIGAITEDMKSWMEEAITAFGKKLPVQRSSRSAKKISNPFDRVTALFLCTRCTDNSPEKPSSPLSLHDACQHDCPHLTNKQKRSCPWSADQFELDHKVLNFRVIFVQIFSLTFLTGRRSCQALHSPGKAFGKYVHF